VVGGGEIATLLFSKRLIDELIISIIPYMIGNGIPWIQSHNLESEWFLKGYWATSRGVIQLQYVRQ
jgi:dihydrofolate reductase